MPGLRILGVGDHPGLQGIRNLHGPAGRQHGAGLQQQLSPRAAGRQLAGSSSLRHTAGGSVQLDGQQLHRAGGERHVLGQVFQAGGQRQHCRMFAQTAGRQRPAIQAANQRRCGGGRRCGSNALALRQHAAQLIDTGAAQHAGAGRHHGVHMRGRQLGRHQRGRGS